VAEAARNLVSSGARPLALTDCLNFGSPERPEVMWQFKEAVEGIKEACNALDVPVIGGNVSFYNETSEKAIYPTPTIGMLGLIEDLAHITRQWFRAPGHAIVLLGRTEPGLGGTEYLRLVHGKEHGPGPAIDLEAEKSLHRACLKAIKAGIIQSAHDCSEGGLAIALAEAALNPDGAVGVMIETTPAEVGLRPDEFLFGETNSRIVVSLHEGDLTELEEICRAEDVPMKPMGHTTEEGFYIRGLVFADLGDMERAYRDSLLKDLEQGAVAASL